MPLNDQVTDKKAVISFILSHEIGHQARGKMVFLTSLISHEENPQPLCPREQKN